ncbi:L,D-transpeptidase family protein [Persicirhabdus sediminis]|uniref:L,D-transpeptidase family protein n=1 Tax=Persicirhabdus sediminis TaxID=454144 RepID=A0A8J7MB39_9BACT|nr:L,D-transpeptidase family protein [Persicirhabdus sediminis]MBK1789852.1 L,D-transpeptidase family protein [Persicirhabdus sediminis]
MKFLSLITISSLAVVLCQCTPYADDSSYSWESGTRYLAGYGPVGGDSFGNKKPARDGQNPNDGGYWDGDSASGPAKIRINRAEQKAYFYKGSQLVGVTPISSGDYKHTTPAGSYKISQKSIDHKSSLYGSIVNASNGSVVNGNADVRKDRPGPGEIYKPAPMPYFLRFNSAIGMHAGYLPGYAASHGCVRMPEHMAEKFFHHASIGTPVIVE